MWKMQLIDVDSMIIRYASEDVVTAKIQEPSTQASYFMVYNMTTATVNLSFNKNKVSGNEDLSYNCFDFNFKYDILKCKT